MMNTIANVAINSGANAAQETTIDRTDETSVRVDETIGQIGECFTFKRSQGVIP